ncbi:MAG TPA: hypothetical protein VFD57_02355 [Clostridia bacterium]|nr:hypothetical protein [Clostridia bacterium]
MARQTKGKKTNRAPRILIISLLSVVLIVGGTLVIVFNIGGIKDIALSFFIKDGAKLDMGIISSQESELEKEREFVKSEQTKLTALRTDLESFKAQLKSREEELNEKEMLISDKEQELDRKTEDLSGQFQDVRELTKIYESMDGEDAAAILSEIEDNEQVLIILKNIKRDKSAEILGLMERKKAADILSNMYR